MLACQVAPEQLVLREEQELKDYKVQLEYQVIKAFEEAKDKLVLVVKQELPVPQVVQVSLGALDLQA